MNRYMVEGVLRDLRAGRRVVVVSGTRTALRAALVDVAGHLVPGEVARRGNGVESIWQESGAGRVRFVSRAGLRGLSADVVVIPDHRPSGDEVLDLRVLEQSGAEVVL